MSTQKESEDSPGDGHTSSLVTVARNSIDSPIRETVDHLDFGVEPIDPTLIDSGLLDNVSLISIDNPEMTSHGKSFYNPMTLDLKRAVDDPMVISSPRDATSPGSTISLGSVTSQEVLLNEQSRKLFSLCDAEKRGFVVKVDLDKLADYLSAADIEELGKKLEDREEKYFDEHAFVNAIESFLMNQESPLGVQKRPMLPELFQNGEVSLADELAVFGMGEEVEGRKSRREEVHRDIYPFSVENKSPIEEMNAYAPPIIKKHQFRPMLPDPFDDSRIFSAPQSLADEMSEAENSSGDNRAIPPELDMRAPDRIFKVVFVGDSAVGKTCFLHRFCHNRFKPLFNATIGVDFTVKTIQLRDRLIAVQLWDTAGQERFRSITKQYFRKADGVVLMYDVTSEQSFLHVRNWIDSVRAGVDDNVVMCLVGNKVDLFASEHARSLTFKAGRQIAQEFGMIFFETSAYTGYGINECMMAMAERLQKREDDHLENALKLEMTVQEKKRSWCCV